MSKVTKIAFVFENCEVLEVDTKDVLLLEAGTPEKRITGQYGYVSEREHITSLYVALSPNAVPSGGSFLSEWDIGRLSGADVTGISFLHADGKKNEYTLDWPKNSTDYESTNQHFHITEGKATVFVASLGFPQFKEDKVQEILSRSLWK